MEMSPGFSRERVIEGKRLSPKERTPVQGSGATRFRWRKLCTDVVVACPALAARSSLRPQGILAKKRSPDAKEVGSFLSVKVGTERAGLWRPYCCLT
jgi:hypothetical protein